MTTKTQAIALIQTALADPSRENFCAGFAAGQEALGFDDNKLASIFKVLTPTIIKWANGKQAPASKAQRSGVLRWMLHEIRKVGLRELVQMTQEMGGYDD